MRALRSTAMNETEGRRGPGLQSRGNRVLLGVGAGFVVQIFAGLLGAGAGVQVVVWAVVGVLVYALTAPRQAGTDSSR